MLGLFQLTDDEDKFIDRYWDLRDISQLVIESHNWYLNLKGKPAFGEDGVTLTRIDQFIEVSVFRSQYTLWCYNQIMLLHKIQLHVFELVFVKIIVDLVLTYFVHSLESLALCLTRSGQYVCCCLASHKAGVRDKYCFGSFCFVPI